MSKIEESLKLCNALHEEEFNISQGDEIQITDTPVDGEVVEPIADPDYDDADTGTSYVGKHVVFCNICMRPFFSDTDDLTDLTCPMCAAEAEDLVVVGKVCAEEEEPAAGEELPGDEVAATDEVPADEEPAAEDKDDKKDDDEEEFEYEEVNMNKLFTKFLTDNYSNAKSFTVTEAKLKNNKLCLEGLIQFNSGKTKSVKLFTESLELKEGTSKVKASCSEFGRSNAFVIEHMIKENKITPTKMNYRFRTRVNNESYEVAGKAIVEDLNK